MAQGDVLQIDDKIQIDGDGKIRLVDADSDCPDCCGCCLATLTISNCTALNGAYNLDVNNQYSDGTVTITFAVTTFTISLDADAQGTFITLIPNASFTCVTDTTWTADDWSGCSGTPSITIECT